jgi:hypothetical protein
MPSVQAASPYAAVRALAVVALLSQASFAQSRQTFSQSLSSSVGLFSTDRDGTGVSFKGAFVYANEFLGLALVPIDLGALSPDSDSPYREIELAGGGTECREKTTGRLVKASNCKSQLLVAASAEALAALPIGKSKSVSVGVGYRAGSTSGVYVISSAYFGPLNGPSWSLALRLGQSFFDLGIGGTLKLK